MRTTPSRLLALLGGVVALSSATYAQEHNPVGLAERAWAQSLADCRESPAAFRQASFWSGELFRAQAKTAEPGEGLWKFAEAGWNKRLRRLESVARSEADRFELVCLRATAVYPHTEASTTASVAALTSLVGALTREVEAGEGDPERLFGWASSLRVYEDELERGAFGGELEFEVEDAGETPAAARFRERMQWLYKHLQEQVTSGKRPSALRTAATYYRLRGQPEPMLELEEDGQGNTVVRESPRQRSGVNAAKACYESALEAYSARRGSALEVWIWSLRHEWEAATAEGIRVEAEQHLARMTKLVEVARATHKTSTPADVSYFHRSAVDRAKEAVKAEAEAKR